MHRPHRFVPAALASLTLTAALALPAGVLAAEPGEARERIEKAEKKGERRMFAVRVAGDGEAPDVQLFPFDGKFGPRGYLGVGLTDLTPALRAHFGVPEESGVMVSEVDQGSPAEKAGIKVGDIITTFDGQPIENTFELRLKVRQAEDGAATPLEVWRGGRAQSLTATLEKRERAELDLAPFVGKLDGKRLMLLGDGENVKQFDVPLNDILQQVEGTPGVRVQRFHLREAELEKQLKDLEKRIQELEKQLQRR
jgi:membrane-associated protease RseP (regulator of RpoE activity)